MYWLNTFDGLTIPRTLGDSGSQDITLGEAPSRAMVVPGSVYDPFGTDRSPRGISRITASVLIVGATEAAARTVLDSWQAKVGVRGALTKVTEAGGTLTATARLTEARVVRSAADRLSVPLSLSWDVLTPTWAGSAHSVAGTFVGGSGTLTLVNDGNTPVINPIITLHAGGTTITSITAGLGSEPNYAAWSWNGMATPIPAGADWVMDCGGFSILNNGSASYSQLSLLPQHSAEPWVTLTPGTHTFTIDVTGGGTTSTYAVAYNDAWS